MAEEIIQKIQMKGIADFLLAVCIILVTQKALVRSRTVMCSFKITFTWKTGNLLWAIVLSMHLNRSGSLAIFGDRCS